MAQDAIDELLFSKSPYLKLFLDKVGSERSLLIEELWEAPKALLISLLAKKSKKNLLVVSGGTDDRLLTDVSFFHPECLLEFPSWETLPGEEIAPSPDLVGKRLEVLHALLEAKEPQILFAPLQAALQLLPHPSLFRPLAQTWKKGESKKFSTLAEKLSALGYKRAAAVSDKGEFALRGGILDLFPLSSTDPYRIEFFADQIEQIRLFDPISQKSTHKVDSFFLPPAFEIGKEGKKATLLDYLGKDTIVIFNDLLAIEDHWVAMKNLPGSKSSLFSSLEQFVASTAPLSTLLWSKERVEELSSVKMEKRAGRAYYTGKEPLQPLSFHLADLTFETKRLLHPFIPIADALSPFENQAAATKEEILQGLAAYAKQDLELFCLSSTEAEKKAFLSSAPALPKSTHHYLGYLSSGFFLEEPLVALLPMTELSHRLKPRRQKWRSTTHTPASEFHELSIGDIVVHYHNGIAKYLGTEKRPNHVGAQTEFIVLEYADESKLFVPVSQSHLVSRYIGTKEEVPHLSQLGSNRWAKTRATAQKAIIGYADQLLRMHAKRELEGGVALPPDSELMQLFENDFPFVETQDQLLAIDAIRQEMQSTRPMDRLICGDVGYGKTEVAMRAAFKTVVDGHKQVALLVPTTVLAMQHFETFSARMANFPIKIGILSRFRSVKENKETLALVKQGKIDILIGTHRLLSKDVHFHDLGLLIIDEEQRFGVRAKESLKDLKAGVDCLTLSATPIPRTLYLSLVGAREISTINTPPQDRLPIKSIIATKEPSLVKNALLRELSRDGQAFFVHNRVESIFRVSEEIQQLLPEARIVTAHGQMSSDELDTLFHTFKRGDADILVSTTIIENGIDIPNANTILIDRADTFGLADLYQMRGRVGRWNRPAFAYFLVPSLEKLPDLTRKRLHALSEASGFGAGMKIALRDLEIRGAGDILGTQQSGHVSSIGFHLYCKLLKRAIDALKHKQIPSFTETKMEFPYDASLPETYINESELRMEIYHRLGEATTNEEVELLLGELKDRFGPYPPSVLWLYHLTRLRLFASAHHFTALKFENVTLHAERQTKETLEKRVLPLPRTQDPKVLEALVIDGLKKSFNI